MRKLIVALSLAFVASAAASLLLWRELAAERERNRELISKLGQQDVAAEPGRPSDPVFAAPIVNAASPSPTPATTATEPDVPPNAQSVQEAAQAEWEAQQRRLFSDPRYRDAWRAQRRLNYAPRRANAIRIVGLTPGQADAVIEFQLDQELRWQERGPNAQVTREMLEEEERVLETQLRGLLGDEKYTRWNGYMESRPSRMQVDRLRTELTGADAIRDDQVEPLIAALHAEHAQARKALEEYQESLRANGHDGNFSLIYGQREIEEMKAMHRRMHDSAAAVLSPSQLRLLDAMLERDLARRENELHMNKLQRKVAVQAGTDAG
jgi:hypothetical protein